MTTYWRRRHRSKPERGLLEHDDTEQLRGRRSRWRGSLPPRHELGSLHTGGQVHDGELRRPGLVTFSMKNRRQAASCLAACNSGHSDVTCPSASFVWAVPDSRGRCFASGPCAVPLEACRRPSTHHAIISISGFLKSRPPNRSSRVRSERCRRLSGDPFLAGIALSLPDRRKGAFSICSSPCPVRQPSPWVAIARRRAVVTARFFESFSPNGG